MWLKGHNKTKLNYSDYVYSMGTTERKYSFKKGGEIFLLNLCRNNDFFWRDFKEIFVKIIPYKHVKLFSPTVLKSPLEFSSMELKFAQHSSGIHFNVADEGQNSQVCNHNCYYSYSWL